MLDSAALTRVREIATGAEWVDGRGSNPTNTGKNNLQVADGADFEESGKIMGDALGASPAFQDFAIPAAFPPPRLSLCREGMGYAAHGDNALISLPGRPIRNDLACTIFLSEPESYEGGALIIHQGDVKASIKLPAGHAVVYPATTVHEVETVTRGERLVGFTFIQSRIADPGKRELLASIGTIARAERKAMSEEGYARLLVVHQNLARRWIDSP